MTAIEFSMALLPFLLLVFGIFEFGRMFHLRATLDDAADQTIRKIYIAQINPHDDEGSLEAAMTAYARSVIARVWLGLLKLEISAGSSVQTRTMTLSYPFRFTVNLTGEAEILLHTSRAFVGS